jgi:molybdopterin-guanine dinucleotide biosynthesis protein A
MAVKARGGGAILAGGKSLRMGHDKPLLQVSGSTLLERCAEALRPIVVEVIVVADVAERFNLSNCRVVGDHCPGTGPVGGIVTALKVLGEGTHVVVACDMPFLQTDLLQMLLEFATEDYDAIVPWIDGRPEPLCAVYRHTCAAPFLQFLASGQRAANRALETVRVKRAEEGELRKADPHLISFTNLNTPEDAGRWLGMEPRLFTSRTPT